MAKNTASIPAKITGLPYAAAEFETLRGFVDAPLQALSTFDGSLIKIDGTGSYDNFTMSANLEFTFAESGHEKGNMEIVKITSDGTKTLTFTKPTAYPLVNYTGLINEATLASGINVFGFFFDGTEISMYRKSGENVTNSAPTLLSVVVASDNGSIVITGNKSLYANNDGTGDLQVTDFTAGLAGGIAINPVLSVPTHSAGDSTAGFTLAYTGVADGSEVLTITPADGSSVFEVTGLAMDSGESVNDTLEDQTAPSFSSAEVGNIDDTTIRTTIRITMDEACDPASTPATTAFTPAGIASTPTVTVVNITGVFIDLTLSAAAVDSDTPTIAYTKPGSNFLKDTAPTPNETSSWTAEAVTNNVSGAFTPADLGTKLLNWWDGTIVDVTGTDVDNWLDQKGSIDFVGVATPQYDAANDKIVCLATNNEYLQADLDAASFDRNDGEHWIVINHALGTGSVPFSIGDTSDDTNFLMFQILSTNLLRIATGGGNNDSTTALSSGKNILRIKSNGSAYTVELNDVDITSEFSGAPGTWENDIIGRDTVSIAALRRISDVIQDLEIHALLRCDDNLTAGDVTNMYNYLNAKY